jgi:hypothetical protein
MAIGELPVSQLKPPAGGLNLFVVVHKRPCDLNIRLFKNAIQVNRIAGIVRKDWVARSKFEIPAVKGTRAYLLADPQRAELKVTQTDSGVSIALPEKAPDAIASVVCVETKH